MELMGSAGSRAEMGIPAAWAAAIMAALLAAWAAEDIVELGRDLDLIGGGPFMLAGDPGPFPSIHLSPLSCLFSFPFECSRLSR